MPSPTQPIRVQARHTLALLCGAAALAWTPAGHAADAAAAVQVTGLHLSTSTGQAVIWLPDSGFQALYAESREAGGLGGNQLQEPPAGTWADLLLATSTPSASASATGALDGRVAVRAGATLSAFSSTALPSTGASWALWSGEFTLASAGTVSITVDYLLSASAVAGNPADNPTDTWAQAALMLSLSNLADGTGQTETFSLASGDAGNGSLAGQVTLSLALAGPLDSAGFSLRANADASASAVSSVPEPAPTALLLGGLAVLALLRRARSAA